jgi:hypothetical protein
VSAIVLGSLGIGVVWGWLIALFARGAWAHLRRSAAAWALATAFAALIAWTIGAAAGMLWFITGVASSWAVATLWHRSIAMRDAP